MFAVYAIRQEERNDLRVLAKVAVDLRYVGLRIDYSRSITCRRNGGLWQYTLPVEEHIG